MSQTSQLLQRSTPRRGSSSVSALGGIRTPNLLIRRLERTLLKVKASSDLAGGHPRCHNSDTREKGKGVETAGRGGGPEWRLPTGRTACDE